MTASSNITISAHAPPYAFGPITTDRTGCGGGLETTHWNEHTYIGDFPPVPRPDMIGVGMNPMVLPWSEHYPRTAPIDPTEAFKRAMLKLTPPHTKFRTTESGDRILLSLDIPGVRRGGLELTIEGYVVTVKAFRADTNQKIEETITLTQQYDVDPNEIDAWHEDGVLTIAFVRKSKGPVKIGVR